MEISNRKAKYEYYIVETYEAGMKLKGENVKQIVNGQLDISTSFCHICNGEIFVCNIPFFDCNKIKLLLHRKEILKLKIKQEEKHLSIIPLKIYSKNNKFKMAIALCKPKRNYDKREVIKKRDIERDLKKI